MCKAYMPLHQERSQPAHMHLSFSFQCEHLPLCLASYDLKGETNSLEHKGKLLNYLPEYLVSRTISGLAGRGGRSLPHTTSMRL